jgi:hypothetical protein
MSKDSGNTLHRLQFWCVCALMAATFLVFAGVRGHEFVHLDDASNIYANPRLEGGLSREKLVWIFTDTSYARRYVPLAWLCYGVNLHLFGLSSTAFHLGNLILHALNTVLLFFLLKRLLMASLKRSGTGGPAEAIVPCAFAGALFWAVNPLRVETVGWASAQIYNLMFLFAGIWLLTWLESQNPDRSERARAWLRWLSVLAYAASLLTYPLALFAPIVLFALEILPLRRVTLRLSDWIKPGARAIWLDKVPHLLVAASVLAATLFARAAPDPQYRLITLDEFGIVPRLMQSFYVWAYYVWKPWLPLDLAPSYMSLHAFDPFEPRFLFSAMLVVGFTVWFVVCRKRWPAAFLFWTCHLLLLVPVLGLTEYPHSTYDRYSHLHGILWSGAIAFALHALCRREATGRWRIAAVVGATAALAFFAALQLPMWRNTMSVYQRIVARAGEHPNRSRFDEVLGVQHLKAGRTNEAITAFGNALAYEARRTDRRLIDEGILPRVNLRLADLFIARGQTNTAIRHYLASAKSDGATIPQILTAGAKLNKLGELDAAVICLEQGLRSAPKSPGLHHQLGTLLLKLGKHDEAERHFTTERQLTDAGDNVPARAR